MDADPFSIYTISDNWLIIHLKPWLGEWSVGSACQLHAEYCMTFLGFCETILTFKQEIGKVDISQYTRIHHLPSTCVTPFETNKIVLIFNFVFYMFTYNYLNWGPVKISDSIIVHNLDLNMFPIKVRTSNSKYIFFFLFLTI